MAWDPADMAEPDGVHWAMASGEVAATRVTVEHPAMVEPPSVKATVPVGVAPEPPVGATVAV